MPRDYRREQERTKRQAPKDTVLRLRVGSGLLDRLAVAAEKAGVTVSEFVRKLILAKLS